ncbi:unnamed protein product, partial [Polarella glacialis]
MQGSNVKDSDNNSVFFQDTSSAPTCMSCIRSVVSYGQLSGGGASQSDAEQAYIQPLLDDNIHIFIHVPNHLMTEKMKSSAAKCSNPVFRLRRPLYGWSRSGNIWEKHLSDTLLNLHEQAIETQINSIAAVKQLKGWKTIDERPQTFWKIGTKGTV